MPNYLDNLDVIDANNQVHNVQLRDRNSMALATEAIGRISTMEKLNIVTPQMFGALADGSNDDTQSIVDALATGKTVYFPKGVYRITDTIDIPTGANLVGQLTPLTTGNQFGVTILHDGDGDTFNVPNYHPCTIANMMLDKTNSVNGNGINIELVDGFTISNVKVRNHNNGIRVVGCSYGIIDKCTCENNYNDGFYFSNNETLNVCQIQISDCLSELNNGSGFHYVSQRPTMPVGRFTHNMTFANHRGGIVYEATGNNKVTGIKIDGCFIGGDDTLGGIYVNATDYPVLIDNCYIEMSGVDHNGRDYATLPSGYGNNIAIRDASAGVSITNCTLCNSAESGISIANAANDVTIANCIFKNNGVSQSASAVQKSDVLITDGQATINGCIFNETPNGVYVYTNNEIRIIGNTFNNTSGVTNTGSGTKIKFNIGVTDN